MGRDRDLSERDWYLFNMLYMPEFQQEIDDTLKLGN